MTSTAKNTFLLACPHGSSYLHFEIGANSATVTRFDWLGAVTWTMGDGPVSKAKARSWWSSYRRMGYVQADTSMWQLLQRLESTGKADGLNVLKAA